MYTMRVVPSSFVGVSSSWYKGSDKFTFRTVLITMKWKTNVNKYQNYGYKGL